MQKPRVIKVSCKQIEELKKNKNLPIIKISPIQYPQLPLNLQIEIYKNLNIEKQLEAIIEIMKSYGNPFDLLENKLDSLRIYNLPNSILEDIAVLLIYSRILKDYDNISEWKNELNSRKLAVQQPYIRNNTKDKEEYDLQINLIQSRLKVPFLNLTIYILSEIIPEESVTEKYIVISELLNELNIFSKSPFPTLEEAEHLYKYGKSSQPGRKTIYDRISKEVKGLLKNIDKF